MNNGFGHYQPAANTWDAWINKCLPRVLQAMVARQELLPQAFETVRHHFTMNANAFLTMLPNQAIKETDFENMMHRFILENTIPALQPAYRPNTGFGGGFGNAGHGYPSEHPALAHRQGGFSTGNFLRPQEETIQAPSLVSHANTKTDTGSSSPYSSPGATAQTPGASTGDKSGGLMDMARVELATLGSTISERSASISGIAETTMSRYESANGEVTVNNVRLLRGMNDVQDIMNIRASLLPDVKQTQTFDIYKYHELVTINVPLTITKKIFTDIGNILSEAQDNKLTILDIYPTIIDRIEQENVSVVKAISNFLVSKLNQYLERYIFFSDEPTKVLSVDTIEDFSALLKIGEAGFPRFESYNGYYTCLNQIASNIFGDLIYTDEDNFDGIICDPTESNTLGDCLHAAGNQHLIDGYMNRDYGTLVERSRADYNEEDPEEVMAAEKAEKNFNNFMDNGLCSRTVLKVPKWMIITNDSADFIGVNSSNIREVPKDKIRSVGLLTDKLVDEKLLPYLPIVDIVYPDKKASFAYCLGLGASLPLVRQL